MSFERKEWATVSLHEVVLHWLRAERHSNVAAVLATELLLVPTVNCILDNANLDDAVQNRLRLRLLYRIRNNFVLEIPPDTAWYKVRNLTHQDLGTLYAVNFHSWRDPADNNELLKVAERKKLQLATPPSAWEPPILWGHDKTGPFTIIEGNNRLTAYAASGNADIDIPVYVGLSPLACHWHVLDQTGLLLYDLINRPASP